jgi:hypothetical protein
MEAVFTNFCWALVLLQIFSSFAIVPLLMRPNPNAFENFYVYLGGRDLAGTGQFITSLIIALAVFNDWNLIIVVTFLAFGCMRNIGYWLHAVS